MTPRVLAIMGSGETAPTMIKPHRTLLERAGTGPAVLLDTPYGFQENATDISSRAQNYFAESVGRPIDVVSWRRDLDPGLAREQALTTLRSARWVFAGPGSPTYALRQWRGTPIPGQLERILTTGGVVVFASAAALTLGSHTVPVYEIYKAGEEPRFEPGLDLIRAVTGLPAVVIPHYDNAEGGHHDTRFCYLGERRLSMLEPELPDESFVLGVDEHTAVILDLEARTAAVVGNGTMTIRRRGVSVVHPAGTIVSLDELASNESGRPRGVPQASTMDSSAGEPPSAASLRSAADHAEAEYASAFSLRDIDGCVGAVLHLEQTIVDWSADTLTSDERDHARAVLRSMVVRLGEVAREGVIDPRHALTPLVEALLSIRAKARASKDFATSDAVRDHLVAAGVDVRDTPAGVEWDLRNGEAASPRV
jgi:cyanophycinase-like exopeptidase